MKRYMPDERHELKRIAVAREKEESSFRNESKLERLVRESLDQLYVNYIHHYRTKHRMENGYFLEFPFYLRDLGIIIDIDYGNEPTEAQKRYNEEKLRYRAEVGTEIRFLTIHKYDMGNIKAAWLLEEIEKLFG